MAKIKITLKEPQIDNRLLDERGLTPQRLAIASEEIFTDDKGRRYCRDSPIERAMSRNQISRAQYNAAQKYYGHCYHGGLMGGLKSAELTMVFQGFGPKAGLARNEHQLFHRDRVAQAGHIMGKRAWIVEDVVIREKPFAIIGQRLGWSHKPQAIAAAVQETRSLLDALCDAWGIFE